MSIWSRYPKELRENYIKYLQIYGALSNLFLQKKGASIPYLDSKFQETVYAKIFNSQNVDIGNTPHDVLSVFGDERIGIGIKTWMNSKPSYQKVMQLKRYQEDIMQSANLSKEALALKISEIRNEKIRSDYVRLGLSEDKNIYHYVTRDKGQFIINECPYTLIDINKLNKFNLTKTAFTWSDNLRDYKFTFGDSQIWQKFDSKDSLVLDRREVKIIEDPFELLHQAYDLYTGEMKEDVKQDVYEVYLPLYSYKNQNVGVKSGLNVWNSASKTKGSDRERPLNEIYIPIPIEFHHKYPDFFTKDINELIRNRKEHKGSKKDLFNVRFKLQLPNGKQLPGSLTQEKYKGLESGSRKEKDETGQRYGQSALGQWLLIDVLGLKERQLATLEWLQKKGTDSVRLWRDRDDIDNPLIYIDFAAVGSFEAFIRNEPIPQEDEYFEMR